MLKQGNSLKPPPFVTNDQQVGGLPQGRMHGSVPSLQNGVTQERILITNGRDHPRSEAENDRAQLNTLQISLATVEGDDQLDQSNKKKRKVDAKTLAHAVNRAKKATTKKDGGKTKTKKRGGKETKKGDGLNVPSRSKGTKAVMKENPVTVQVPEPVQENVEQQHGLQEGGEDSGRVVREGSTVAGEGLAGPEKNTCVRARQNTGLAWKAKPGVTAVEPKLDDLGCEHMGMTNLFMRGRVLPNRMKWYMAEGRFQKAGR